MNKILRRHYPAHGTPGTIVGAKLDHEAIYGLSDLFYFAHALTGQARYLDAAKAILYDVRAFAGYGGASSIVDDSKRILDLFSPGTSFGNAAGRRLSWWLTSGTCWEWWR